MRIAGKQVPWWWLVVAVVVFAAVVVAVLLSSGTPGDKVDLGLPDGTQGSAQPSPNSTTSAGVTPGKSETTQSAGSGRANDDPGGSGGPSNNDGSPGGPGATVKQGYLVVKYWNDTVSNDPGQVEVVVGDASWKPRATRESDQGKVGPTTLGNTQQLVIYPDGRDGEKITVSIVLRADMSGNERDAVHVELRDKVVRVLGNPVVGFEVAADRG